MNSVSHRDFEAKVAVSGKALARKLRNATPGARAIAALPLLSGTALVGATWAQAARVANVSVHSLAIAASASTTEREGLRSGTLTLKAVRRAHVQPCKPIDDNEIVDFINRVDPNRVLAILDAMTAPPQLAMAAE